MKRKVGALCMALGALLLMAALGVFMMNEYWALQAADASGAAMAQLLTVIEGNKTIHSSSADTQLLPTDREDATTEITHSEEASQTAGNDPYIGYLTIYDLDLQLPVLAELSEEQLELAPCRYYGSVAARNLVICAHNYYHFFGNLHQLKPGAQISFTDINGITTLYEVDLLERLTPSQSDEMAAGEYPLTLFTCNYMGNRRVTVRCVYAGA